MSLCCKFSYVTIHGTQIVSSCVDSISTLAPSEVCAQCSVWLFSVVPGMLLTYFLNAFEIVPVAPIVTGITVVFTFHVRFISIVRSLYFNI
jgi:hypothetical protein